MDLPTFIQMLLISALIGGLVGVEREKKVKVIAGTRTFMLCSMIGFLSVYISKELELDNFLLLSFAAIIFISLLVGILKNLILEDIGVTTSVALVLVFFLGVMVGVGRVWESIAGSVLISAILVSKKFSVKFSETLTREEMRNALEFGIVAFILYPLVPDRFIDPFGILNPRLLVTVIIIVSSIGFFAYIALREVGVYEGLPIVGGLGGLVNSEATATTLSVEAKSNSELVTPAVHGIILSDVAMLLRNLAVAGAISIEVLGLIAFPIGTMAVAGILYFKLFKPERKLKEAKIELELPFALFPALKFAIFFILISAIANYLRAYGTGTIYLVAVVGGLISSAAVTAAAVSMHSFGTLNVLTAAYACILASLSSTFVKIFISKLIGSDALAKKLAGPSIIMIFLGILALLIQIAL